MAGINLLPARFPVAVTTGNDVTITLDVNDALGANYTWSGKTVVAPIVGHATVTGWTVDTSTDGTLVLSLTDAQTTALGSDAGFEWSLSVTVGTATRTWLSGPLSVFRPGRPGATNTTTGTLTVAESTGTAVTIEVGAVGPAGVGVEPGGTTGQVLTKASNTDYDTEWSTPAGGGDMLASANLSDLADAATARTNLGLGSAAVLASTAFDAAGAAAAAQAASQPLDADLTALAGAGNSAVLAATTASFLIADESKLDGIEAGATADQSAAEILAALLTVDGAGSGLDADLLDGNSSAAFATSGHTHTGVYEAVGVAAALVDDLSGVTDAATARTNLGLGTAATTAATDYATAAQGTTADAAVPKSLVDAKGDLLVATADNTVARLAVGTNDYVLTADSAEATGVKWAAASGGSGGGTRPGNAAKSGLTYWGFTPDIIYMMQAQTSGAPTTGVLYYIPMWVPQATRITAMAVRPRGGTGASGREVHVGIYAANASWQPTGSPLTDQTLACTSDWWIEATGLTVDLQPGPYLKCITSNNSSLSLELRRMGPLIGHSGGSVTGTINQGVIYNPRVAFTYGALPTATAWDTVSLTTDINQANDDYVPIQFTAL